MNKYVIAPGETIKELLEVNFMSQVEFANKIGVSASYVNELLNGNAPITNSLAIKLENIFGMPVSFWLNLEKNYKEDYAG